MENSQSSNRTLKLNYKNTLKIGLAFFGILMLWQVYNIYCPIILEAMLKDLNVEHYNYIIGVIMALDNVVAIIIMPIVGKLSDKTSSKLGKRMPYITNRYSFSFRCNYVQNEFTCWSNYSNAIILSYNAGISFTSCSLNARCNTKTFKICSKRYN